LKDWSKANAEHMASMKTFDETLNSHLTGTVTGLAAALGGVSAGGNWSASSVLGGEAAVTAQATYNAVQQAFSTSGMWGATPQSSQATWGQAGSGGSWVGTGASAQGIGFAASSQLASGQSSGYGYSISGGTVHIGKYAEGGVVTKPTLALIGEAGEKEAVVPLSKAAEMGFGGEGASGLVHTIINIDGRKVADAVGPAMVQRMRTSAGIKVR